ncbi:MAG TPA: NAD-dependent epimerase/dehydratase family protein [Candidatus Binataceae bacterium]|nr:NAD-dependent epimerase/dehydratase family protein [Candidatus Binataceae bacterium]
MRLTQTKALVLGATGHIGNAILRELLSQGCEVTAASRRREPAPNLVGLPVRYARGDADTPGQLEAWIAGHDLVVDAAAPYPLYLRNPPVEAERDPLDHAAERTRRLLDAVGRHNAILAYVSTFATLWRSQGRLEDWQTLLMRRLHPHFAVKELIETRMLDAARRGTPVVVVNPTLCLGPWDTKVPEWCLVPRLLRGEIPAFPSHVLNVIDVRDLAAATVSAITAERYGEPILLDGHNISTDELFNWICEVGGVAPPRYRISLSLTSLSAYLAEALLGLAGRPAPLPSLVPILISQHEWITSGRVHYELGISPRPLSETLADSVEWYRGLGYC